MKKGYELIFEPEYQKEKAMVEYASLHNKCHDLTMRYLESARIFAEDANHRSIAEKYENHYELFFEALANLPTEEEKEQARKKQLETWGNPMTCTAE